MVRCHKINVMHMIMRDQIFQLPKQFAQTRMCAQALMGDLVILAERAFEGATTEKHGS